MTKPYSIGNEYKITNVREQQGQWSIKEELNAVSKPITVVFKRFLVLDWTACPTILAYPRVGQN